MNMIAIRKNDDRWPTVQGFLSAAALVVLVLMATVLGPARADAIGSTTRLALATPANVGSMASVAAVSAERVPHAVHAADTPSCADHVDATGRGGAKHGFASRHVTHAEPDEGCPMSICAGVCAGSGIGMSAALVTGLDDAGARAIVGLMADGPQLRASASGVPLRPPKVRAFSAG